MSNEIKNAVAIELSEDELDAVAGGLSISLGDGQGFVSDASNTFSQKNLSVGQLTYAGPNGSGTASTADLENIFSSATQGIAISL